MLLVAAWCGEGPIVPGEAVARTLGLVISLTTSVTDISTQRCNRLAPRLDKRGYPGHLTGHLIKEMLYPTSISQPVQSLFEAIEQNEAHQV